MLKVRAMGSVKDIEWFAKQLNDSDEIEVLDHSEILALQGTKNFFRIYFQVQEKNNNTSENEE